MPIPKQEPIPEKPAMLILHMAALHERQLGIGGLALVLKGSKSKRVFDRKFYESKLFGALFYRPLTVIENFIKQLVAHKYLRIIDIGERYAVPVLELADAGKDALDKGQDVPLQEIKTVKPTVLNESIQETVALFKELKNVPAVAQQRQLANGTIWGHLRDAIELQIITPAEVVSQEKIQLIRETRDRLPLQGLKEIKAALPPNITYDEILIALRGAP